MTLFVERLRGWVAPADVFTAFYGDLENAFWLDREAHDSEPCSVMGSGAIADQTRVDELTRRTLATRVPTDVDESDLPFAFRPGVVGVVGYEAGLNSQVWIDVDRAIVFDHKQRHIFFVAELAGRQDFEDWFHAALLRLALIGGNSKLWRHLRQPAEGRSIRPMLNRENYVAAVNRAKAAIAAGDSYQICLTNRLRGDFSGDPLAYFLELRASHPAPYAAYLKVGDTELVSISPERLVTIRDSRIWSSPIKGTRARSAPGLDQLEVHALQGDPKERAENLMIVDLLRNDLLRVCEASSVIVDEMLSVKTYSTLHQLVSQVSGELRPDVSFAQVIAACFPAGSMTGAPKLAAMNIISELEPDARGLYSGGLGYISNLGTADFGMVIRSVLFRAGEFEIGVGGGLTSDSDPEREFSEMTLKAKALIDGLRISPSW